MSLTRISGPAVEPISLADARLQCRLAVDDTAEDTLLSLCIQAAREAAEHQLGRALISQTWEQTHDGFPAGAIALQRSLASSITSIECVNTAGATVTLDGSAYTLQVSQQGAEVQPAAGGSWPAVTPGLGAVRVRYVVGYGAAAADVPAAVRQWLLVTVAAFYAQREAFDATGRASALPERFVDRLLDAERIYA